MSLGDHSQPFEHIYNLFIRTMRHRKPNIYSHQEAIIKEGPQAYKVATLFNVRNPHTGEHHHSFLRLDTFNHTVKNGWVSKPEYSFTITNDNGSEEIKRLYDFLGAIPLGDTEGNRVVFDVRDMDTPEFHNLLHSLFDSSRRRELISEILSWVNQDTTALNDLTELATDYPMRSKALVAALNYAQYRRTLDELKRMVEAPNDYLEIDFQRFLTEHWWMFGSEYSQLFSVRELSLGIQVDFPLRRTIDDYLEIIEIKTPSALVMRFDKASKQYSMSTQLISAKTQVEHYLEALDDHKADILLNLKIPNYKTRGKIVIGRNENDDQQKALRRTNEHENRIEIITFDQLIAIAERVLSILDAQRHTPTEE